MGKFKESMTAQFQQRQVQVKETIGKIKADFEKTIAERDAVCEHKVQKAEEQVEKCNDISFVLLHGDVIIFIQQSCGAQFRN